MTIEKIPLITGLNDVPATDAVKGQNGALVIAKVNQIVDVVNALADDSGDDSGGDSGGDSTVFPAPKVIVLPEQNTVFTVESLHANSIIFLGSYQRLNFDMYAGYLGNEPYLGKITIINTTSFDIPLGGLGNINFFVCPDDSIVGPNNQALRSKGKLEVYFQDTDYAYIFGSIINVSSGS
jgi:hypothetical protein